MIKKNGSIYFLLIILMASNLLGEDSPATTGLAFLKIGAGSRAVGMGEAFSALSNDVSATYWNPAGLAKIDGSNLMFTHNKWLQDITNEFVAVNFQVGSNVFGLSLMTSTVGGIERRVIASDEPLGEINAHNLLFGLSYARNVRSDLSIGATVKFLYEKIYVESSSGFAVDLGGLYQTPVSGLSLGLSLQNFGYLTELKQETTKLPQTIRLGAGYLLPFNLLQGQMTAATDFVKIIDNTSHLNLGFEYNFKNFFALRCGYQTGHDDKGIHAGFGVSFKRYQLDYAYVPFSSDLGNSHRISFGLSL